MAALTRAAASYTTNGDTTRQKARPSHPKADPAAREAFAKRGSRANWTASGPSTQASA